MKPDALHLCLQTTTAHACGGMGRWAKDNHRERGDSVQHVVTHRTRVLGGVWEKLSANCSSGHWTSRRSTEIAWMSWMSAGISRPSCLALHLLYQRHYCPEYFANFKLPLDGVGCWLLLLSLVQSSFQNITDTRTHKHRFLKCWTQRCNLTNWPYWWKCVCHW